MNTTWQLTINQNRGATAQNCTLHKLFFFLKEELITGSEGIGVLNFLSDPNFQGSLLLLLKLIALLRYSNHPISIFTTNTTTKYDLELY